MLRANALPFATLALVTAVAWGGALLTPNALFWDDWVTQNDPFGLYHDIGLPWMAPVFWLFVTIGPWTFKVLGVLALAAVGCLLYLIAGRGLGLSRFERWLVAVLIIVLPFNTARVGVAVLSTYILSVTAFVIAWYLLVFRSPSAPGVARYIVAAVLMFVSYTTASLLPFTLVPLAHLALLTASGSDHPFRDLLREAGRRWYLFAAPLVFWVVRSLFFRTSGLYLDYNTFVSLSRPLTPVARDVVIFVAAALAIGAAIAVSELRGPLNRRWIRALAMLGLSFLTLEIAWTVLNSGGGEYHARPLIAAVLAIGALLSVFGAGRIASSATEDAGARVPPRILAVGLLLFILGALPYMLVGKEPSFYSWDTRHQLLLPFGAAVILLAGLRSVSRWRVATRAIGLAVVAASTLVAAAVSLSFAADGNKQSQIIAALRQNSEMRAARTVVFEDHSPSLNFDSRPYAFYEVDGWMRTAFHDQTRYALTPADVSSFGQSTPAQVEANGSRYGYRSYRYTTKGVLLEVQSLPGATWLGLLFDQPSISITVTPYPDITVLKAAP